MAQTVLKIMKTSTILVKNAQVFRSFRFLGIKLGPQAKN